MSRTPADLLSSLRPRYPQGSVNTPVVPAATAEAAVNEQPVQSEQAAALQATGMDALEVAKFPDFPSMFERFNEMQRSLEQIAALLEASLPKPPIFVVVYIGADGAGISLNKHGRRYCAVRSLGAQTAHTIQFRTATGTSPTSGTLAVQGLLWNFLLEPEGTYIFAKDSTSAGNYELVYLDEIPAGNDLTY